MDRLDRYRQIVQKFLEKHGEQKLSYGDVETELIFDKERDRYQVVHVGWDRDPPELGGANRFVYGCSIHIDIKNGKVWIQWNSTEDDVAAELVALGVAKSDIVLGLHPPELRKYTDYAVC